jgi:hypothetical protein
MPYQYTDFIGVPLPDAMPEDDLSTGQVSTTLAASIGNVYDAYGSARRWPGAHQFQHKGKYIGQESGDIVERVTPEGLERYTPEGIMRVVKTIPLLELQLKTDALKALIGLRGQLWRRRFFDAQRSWKTCRLLEVKHVETVEQAGVVSEVQSTYETMMNGWHAQTATSVAVNTTAGVATTLQTNNGGMLPVYDGVLTIARTGTAITQVRVTGTGIDITWTGTIAAAQSLVIDAGAQTITNGGADAYSGFVLGASVSDWLPLTLGNNILTITTTGGPATVTLSYYQQWP